MIDCHLHIGHLGRTPDQTLEHIRGLECAAACVLPCESLDPLDDAPCPTEEVLSLYQRAPDLVIPFCHVDPRAENARHRIEAYVKAGCKGFGEHKVRLAVDDERSRELYRLCGDLGLPVLLHLEERNYNFNVLRLEALLSELPNTIFIGHGQSFWAYLEPAPIPVNGYPTGPIETPGPTMQWLLAYPNLYGDLSAGSGLNALTRDEEFTRDMLLGRAWHKLLFGTDCPCHDARGANWAPGCFGRRSRPVIERLAPSPQAAQAVLHDNLVRLLGLPARP
jgi:predicted TIM-barrel fold metal-dependent hydrolase